MQSLDTPSRFAVTRLSAADLPAPTAARQQLPGRKGVPAHDRAAIGVRTSDRAAALGLSAVLLLFAYEWLFSSMNKILSSDFRSGLSAQIADAVTNNPNHRYAAFLSEVVLPHPGVFAFVIE